MPKAKPVSLHPLSFEEAISAFMLVDPQRKTKKRKKTKRKRKAKKS